MHKQIVFLGPMCAGKSTVAQEVAEMLDMQHLPLDKMKWYYYYKLGYSEVKGNNIYEEYGLPGLAKYWEQFDLYTIENVLKEFPNGIIDCGAGQTYYENEIERTRLKELFAPVNNLVLLMPTENLEESIQILNYRMTERGKHRETDEIRLANEQNLRYIHNAVDNKLAKITVYTHNKSLEDVCTEIISRLTD
ncbi:hypothetical protein C7N43_09185 [Sphingobacteriales bacterium UPWRP_1]|nr:hypothetical protein B6N25_07845 [Sphingobacteriales bacterium TSM_CSS]PSJ77302.1 hypothetical protein C7N43_09185 [Sphingobacteriales bacterium UPWRP_1]